MLKEEFDIGGGGERCLPQFGTPWAIEHLHRYAFAIGFSAGKRVLDIASGEGYGSNLLAQTAEHVVGVDISADAVAHAAGKYRRDNLEYRHGRAEAIPLDDGSVDLVVSYETLEHLEDHDQMLREVKRVLKPNGTLIISTPDAAHFPDKRLPAEVSVDKNPFHVRELTVQGFRELMRRHFTHCQFAGQRLVCGSLLVPESPDQGFEDIKGTFTEISRSPQLFTPVFHVCVASEQAPAVLRASFFDGWDSLLGFAWDQLRGFDRSGSYRIGRAITWPLRLLKKR